MTRFLTKTVMATLCMLMLVVPAMATDSPVSGNHSLAAGHSPAAKSDAAEASIGAQGNNLDSASRIPVDRSALMTSWQPAVGYAELQMTNMGEERMVDFQGHDLSSLIDGVAAVSILYAPTEADNPTFRADVAACTGAVVDYFDARVGTPDAALLASYDCVLTWVNYAYADNVLMGNNLAAYVDGGGKVILGQWCLPTAGNYLSGAIMGAGYCPVTATTAQFSTVSYNNDGTDCVHTGVSAYASDYFDQTTLLGGASSDGTFNDTATSLAVAWRADRMVYYSPGNTGATYGTGDWAQLVCNMCDCFAGGGGDVDCVCSGAWNVGDRVTATVSSPQGAFGLQMGHGGTVRGGALAGFPPLFIQWDDWQSGHDGNGVSMCPVSVTLPDTSGWFIDCPDVTPSVNVDCACGGVWNTGDRVMATIDNPDFQPDVYAGDHGTVIAGSTTLGTSRLLISWDGVTSGHDGNGYADCPVVVLDNTSGWWVDCSMVAPVAAAGSTIAVALSASPDSGFTPFTTVFSAVLTNLTTENRRAAARIDATLANGNLFGNWRAGWTNLSPSEVFTKSWSANIPSLTPVLGINTFELTGEDVTPAPYNQPPFAPSGDTDTAVETVEAF